MRLIALFVLFATVTHAAPATPRELQDQFQQALAAKDLKTLVAMYDWQGVSKDMRTTTAMMLDELTRKEIKSIALGHVTQKRDVVVKGVRFRPNLPLAGALIVTYSDKTTTDKVEIPYGKKDGAYFLCSVTAEQVGPAVVRPKQFGISVGGTAAPQPAQFTGFYILVVDGKEVRKDFSGQAGLTRQVHADAIKYCEVRKTSPAGSIYLFITTAGQTVYESPTTDTDAPITYSGSR